MRRYNSISYIVPVYKTPLDLLERCLDTIAPNLISGSECIVAFDGKYTLPKGSKLKKRDGEFRFITYPHAGTFECRKNAIEDAKCDLIIPVDSDDTISVNTTEVVLKEMNKHGYDFSYIPTIEIPFGIIRKVPSTKRKYLKTFFEGKMIWKNSICNLTIVSNELGKRLVEDTPTLKDYIMTEDQAVVHFYMNNCKKFGLIKSQPLYMHYYGTGISTQYDKPRSFIKSQVDITYEFLRRFYSEKELEGYMKNEQEMILRYKDDSVDV